MFGTSVKKNKKIMKDQKIRILVNTDELEEQYCHEMGRWVCGDTTEVMWVFVVSLVLLFYFIFC